MYKMYYMIKGFPGGIVVKNLPANAGDTGDACSIPGVRTSPGVGNGSPFQYSCLESPMDTGAWWPQFMVSQRVRHNGAHVLRILYIF